MHPILNSKLHRQVQIHPRQPRRVERKRIQPDEQTRLHALRRRNSNNIRQQPTRLPIQHDAHAVLGKGIRVAARLPRVRVEVGVLRADGEDHEQDDQGGHVATRQAGGRVVDEVHLAVEPGPVDVEVVALGVVEESPDEEVGDVARGARGEELGRVGGGLEFLDAVELADLGGVRGILAGWLADRDVKETEWTGMR